MRKFTNLLTLLLLALVATVAKAETVAPYTYGFDDLGSGKLLTKFYPPGWGHIVEGYSAYSWSTPVYVEYNANTEGGYDDNGPCLQIGSQTLQASYGISEKEVNDMLVTPEITGAASIYVKSTYEDGSIKFYTCTESDGTYTAGDEYAVTVPTLSTTEWTKVEIPAVPAGTRLGIRGNNVRIDNFTVESAELNLKRGATVLSTPTMLTDADLVADADGNVTITAQLKVKNSGEKLLTEGEEDFYVTIYDNTAKIDYPATKVFVPATLKISESSDYFTVSATVPVTENQRHLYHVMEHVSGTTTYLGWVEVYPNAPSFTLEDDLGHDVNNGDALDFDVMQTAVTKTLVLKNTKGGAPLTINSISVPEGFTYVLSEDEAATESQSLPYSIAARGKAYLKITMDASSIGKRTGDIVITPADGQGDVYTLPVSGEIIDPSKVYINFSDKKFPAGSFIQPSNGSAKWKVENFSYGTTGYAAYNGTIDPLTKFILPKIHLEEGETVTFDANRVGSSSKLNVYYSDDRNDWTLLKSITVDGLDEESSFSNEQFPSGYYDNYKFRTFTLNIPAGDWYIAFEAGYSRVDNIIGGTYVDTPDTEAVLYNVVVPATATVNHESSISFGITSIGKQDIEEGALTAKVYLGDTVVGEQELPALTNGEYETVTVDFTPRTAGTMPTKIEISGAVDLFAKSTIEVAAETAVGELVVGEATTTSGSVPLSLNYKKSESEIIYLADELSGLPSGTAIKSIAFKGYKNSYSNKELTTNLEVYIENTTDTDLKTDGWYTSDNMTKIYDGTYTYAETIGSSSEHKNVLTLNLAEPFVYTGGNLRLTLRSTAETYTSTYFDIDSSKSGRAAYACNDSDLPTSLNTAALPVTVFGFDKEATTLSGVVTDKDGGAAIADAEVKIVSDNVEYSGTTDADGKYSFEVYQDALKYAFTITKEGYFACRDSIQFAGASLVKDATLKTAEGFNLMSTVIPATGEVNSKYTVTAHIENGNAKEADSYTAELWANDAIIATAEAPALKASKEYDFTFSYVPHTAGTAKTFVKFTSDSGYVASDTISVDIKEETGKGEVIVGTANASNTSGPFTSFYKNSQTEIIYPKSMIDLAAGTKVEAISFYGSLSYGKNVQFSVDAWIGNVAEGTELQGNSTEGLTQVADGTIVDLTNGFDNEPVLTLTFPDGFIYDGGDIRIYTEASGSEYASIYFVTDSECDAKGQVKMSDGSLDGKSWSTMASIPVAHFAIPAYKTLSGTVKNEAGEAVANAFLTLTSADDVVYEAETAEDGTFAIQVLKYTNDYTLTVENANYDKYTHAETISLADGDIADLNITLVKTYEFSGQVVDAASQAPIEGAEVKMVKDGDNEATVIVTTDAEGKFSAIFKTLGTYTITATAEGYDDASYEGIEAEGDLAGLVIELTKTVYTISGHVYDSADNTAIEGATVYFDDPESGSTVAEATTDEAGLFTVTVEKLGTYSMFVQATGYDNAISDIVVEGSRSIEVPMTKTVYTISGYVYDSADNSAIEGATIYLDDPESGSTVAEATTDESGLFSITVDKLGTYSILIKAAGYEDVASDILIEGNQNLEVPMVKIVYTVSGLVYNVKTSAPIENATVALYNGEIEAASTTTDATGAFSLELAAKGTYKVVVKAEGYEDFVFEGLEVEYSLEGLEIQMEPESSVGTLTADGLRVYGTTGAVVVESSKDALVRIYNTAGSLIRSEQVAAGKTKIDSLNRGIYVVNGVKVIVK